MQVDELLDFDGCDAVELLLDGFSVFLGRVFLDRLGGAIDQVLGFLQAERGNFANSLDGVDLAPLSAAGSRACESLIGSNAPSAAMRGGDGRVMLDPVDDSIR